MGDLAGMELRVYGNRYETGSPAGNQTFEKLADVFHEENDAITWLVSAGTERASERAYPLAELPVGEIKGAAGDAGGIRSGAGYSEQQLR